MINIQKFTKNYTFSYTKRFLSFELDNHSKNIIEQGKQIHDKYLKQLTLYNLPPKLMELAILSKQQHIKDRKIQAQQKKNNINIILPGINIKPNQNFNSFSVLLINNSVRAYAKMLQNKALQINNKGRKHTADDLLIKSYNRYLKSLIITNIDDESFNEKDSSLNNTDIIQTQSSALYPCIKKKRSLKKKNKKNKKKKKSRLSFSVFKKSNNLVYIKKLEYIKNNINSNRNYIKKPIKKIAPVFKPKPLLPWIVQGRSKHQQLKNDLLKFKFNLKSHRRGIGILTRENKKIIKQFRKKRKFGKYGRYGKFSKFTRRLMLKNKKPVEIVKHNIKRQFLYLQHKRLSMINNISVLPQKYMYMLIIIWYLLMNILFFLYRTVLKKEIWFDLFIRSLWISKTQLQTNNLYLNYGISKGPAAIITNTNLYSPARNGLYHELQVLNSYQRLTINSSSLKKKHSFRSKRKSRVRTFFRISPQSKMNVNYMSRRKFGKRSKNIKSKRLEDKEWLLVTKFTRRKYQYQFNTIFSQWKNIKKIQTYLDKQSQNWHHPYIISNPYYYTNRYKTFIYEMSTK